jgi:hypothetical protein
VKPDAYTLDPRNARTRDARAKEVIRKSLETFGAGRSITIDAENVVISGNGVYEQAIALGIPVREVETDGTELIVVKRTDLVTTAPKRIGLALADNQTATLAKWDEPVLEELKAELLGEIEFEAMGFEEPGEVEDPALAGDLVDQAAALLEKWGVERGQVWEIPGKAGVHRVMCGDSTDAGDRSLCLAGEETVVVTDPPYGISVDTSWLSVLNVQHGKPANKSDDRLRGDDGGLDISGVYRFPQWLVFGFPMLARAEAYTGLLVWDKRGDGGEGGLGSPVEVAASNSFKGYRLVRHVWAGYVREAGEEREAHPTQKPVSVMADAMRFVGGGSVFDPFLGSGSTMMAAEQQGRVCVGIDVEPKYVAVTLERCQKYGMEPVRADG